MSQRYEREIEEILRNMEETDPQPVPPRRPASEPRWRGPRLTGSRSMVGIFILAGIPVLLVAACVTWYAGGPTLLSGLIAAIGVASFLAGLVLGWAHAYRPSAPPTWRGNVVEMRPTSRPSPWSELTRRVQLWRLRQRYRRDLDP